MRIQLQQIEWDKHLAERERRVVLLCLVILTVFYFRQFVVAGYHQMRLAWKAWDSMTEQVEQFQGTLGKIHVVPQKQFHAAGLKRYQARSQLSATMGAAGYLNALVAPNVIRNLVVNKSLVAGTRQSERAMVTTVKLAVQGSYNGLAQYLEQIESLPFLAMISELSMVTASEKLGSVEAEMTIDLYQML